MRRDREAYADAIPTVEQFNAWLSARKLRLGLQPTVAAVLVSEHQWLVIACDSCGTVIDLTVKRRDPNAPIRITLYDVHVRAATVTGQPA